MDNYLVIPIAGLALALGGCSSMSTPYQPVSASNPVSGGYSEMRLAKDRYRVTFSGNDLTSRDKVEGYLLYRAAELTLQEGYDWFSIIERETEHHVDRRMEPDPFYHPWYGGAYIYWQPYWRYYARPYGWRTWYPYWGDPFWAAGVDTRTIERFEATAKIMMHSGAMPVEDNKAFDARDVLSKLGPEIKRAGP